MANKKSLYTFNVQAKKILTICLISQGVLMVCQTVEKFGSGVMAAAFIFIV